LRKGERERERREEGREIIIIKRTRMCYIELSYNCSKMNGGIK